MRPVSFRLASILALACVVLASAVPAGATLRPLRRHFGEIQLPLVRAGKPAIPRGHASGRVRVIARLAMPPLAAAFRDRVLANASGRHTLDVTTAASRAYVTRLTAAQSLMAARVRSAIASTRIGRRYNVILDGFVVSLKAHDLPRLVRLRGITRVYPSYTYTEELNRAPSLIGADVLRAVAGADGRGVKIGVVDDGIDQSNAFFDASGFSYPAGFPRGGRKWTSPKVIVARVFPGPNSGAGGRLAVDPRESFHGTHVAGIAAGVAGTTAPRGADHPTTTGLTGIAPKAWLGNYRVFTVPTPIGNVANTPEIIAAFEQAVEDGMNVINFSGGGPQSDPANDAIVEAMHNVANAGVVPVIAAGNDRDDWGTGSAGSPGTAPDAISVAAVSNTHVFAPALSVSAPSAPDAVKQIPFLAAGSLPPAGWGAADQQLVDVGSLLAIDGRPVDRHLCDVGPRSLPRGALQGSIALIQRGLCPFASKLVLAQSAGAIGVVFVDNREGEANPVPIQPPIPSGMISNLDGAVLIRYLSTTGGRAPVRIGREVQEDVTGRGATMTSFSSGGPTAFGHQLKPDVSAPGGQILSSTLANTDRSRFAVFDGTSMATPHVAGAAALLLQLHPRWTPLQVKSALVSTAGPAWGNTARTQEAPVLLEGGGLVNLPRATDPAIFTDPVSLSFGDLDTTHGSVTKGLFVRLTDAGGGAGTWQVQLVPQSTTAGTSVDLPGVVTVAPGGEVLLPVVAHAAADAPSGEDYGFVVLTNGSITRRVPYLFVVTRPALASLPATQLKGFQTGDTRQGTSLVQQYRYPTAPFGNVPDQPLMEEDGAEKLFVYRLDAPALNFGVSVWVSTPGSQIDPWVLGSKSEDQVQGFAGTPVNANGLMFDYLVPVGAAGVASPREQAFYVSVDSARDRFSNRSLAGQYVLRAWVDDVDPPLIRPLTTRVAAGRPTIAVQAVDLQSGVDPYSLVLAYGNALVGVSLYDPETGLAVFALPKASPPLRAGKRSVVYIASDYQETKNINTVGDNPMPNTAVDLRSLRVVRGPAVTWLLPERGLCVAKTERLAVAASSTRAVTGVRFFDGKRRIGEKTTVAAGLAATTWSTTSVRRGRHTLVAKLTDAAGRTATAARTVRICRK